MTEEHDTDLQSECPSVDTHWYETAKSEQVALKAWKQNGEQGDRPATPTLDDMNERYIAAGCAAGSAVPSKQRSSSTGTTRRGADDDAVVAFAVAARAENPAIKRLQILSTLRKSGMSCSRERLYPLLDVLDAETGWVEPTGRRPVVVQAALDAAAARTSDTKIPKPSSDDVAAALVDALNGDDSALTKIADDVAAAKPKRSRRSKPADLQIVLDEIAKPHTAAELCAIAEQHGIEGVRVKQGKSEIVARMKRAIDARIKLQQKSA